MRLNYRFLLGMLICLAVLGGSAFGLHQWQSSRNASATLSMARAARDAQRLDDSLRLYGKYLALAPNSAEGRAEVGELLADLERYERAFFHLETSLRIDSQQPSVRERLVEVALSLRRFADAKTHLVDHLLLNEPENPEYLWLLAQCENSLGNYAEARQRLEAAVDLAPTDARFTAELAYLLAERFTDSDAARHLLDELVASAPNDAACVVARGRWLLKQVSKLTLQENAVAQQLLADAWADARRAMELQAGSPESAMFAVDAAIANKRPADVRQFIADTLGNHPADPLLYGSAAQLELEEGNRERAVEILQEGLRAVPGHADLIWNLAQLEIDAGRPAAVEELAAELRSRGYPEPPLKYLEARILMSQGKWRDAASLLEKSRSGLDRAGDLLKQLDFMLAACYRNLGNLDQELTALRRAVQLDPLWAPARQALAGAQLRSGRFQEAMSEYWQIVRQPNPPTAAVVSLGRVLLIDGLRRGAQGSEWASLEQLLSILDQDPDAHADAALLRAELHVVKGDEPAAEQLLRETIRATPDAPGLRLALIAFYVRQQNWDAVEREIESSKQAIGDSIALRMEHARYLIRRFGREVDVDLLETLATPTEDWGDAETAQLTAAFASYFLSLEDYERAEKYARLSAASKTGENNLAIHLLLFDLAFRSRDTTSMRQTLQHVRDIEGAGPLWRVGEAVRLAIDAEKSGDAAGYDRAIGHLSEAAVARSGWSRIPKLKGEIFDRQGKAELAIDAYLEAIALGERSPQLVSRAIFLLFEKGRFVEADEVVRKLQEQKTPFTSELTRVASQVSMQLEDFDRALDLAKEWAEQSNLQDDHIWLAQMYSITGQIPLAEDEFRKAISIAPEKPAAWVSLVQMYGRIGDRKAGGQVIAEAENAIKSETAADTLAQCYEALGEYELAEKNYLSAVQSRPNDPGLLRRVGDFYLRLNRQQQALIFLEQLAAADSTAAETDLAWARRNLALLLGLQREEQTFRRAQQLLELNITQAGPTLADRRAKAIILGNRPDRESNLQAISLLEDVAKEQNTFSVTDNFLLAELYSRTGDQARYSRTMRSVLARGGANESRYVRHYVNALIRDSAISEARLWIGRLKEIAPADLRTATAEAQLLFKQQDYPRLISLITERAETDASPQWSAETAEILGERLQQDGGPEQIAEQLLTIASNCYQRCAENNTDQKAAVVLFNARQGKLDLVLKQLESEKEMTVQSLAEIGQAAIRSGALQKHHMTALRTRIASAFESHPDNINLGMSLGDLFSWDGSWHEASMTYDKVLAISPNHIPALNNRAMVLALTGSDPADALATIQRAISHSGPYDYLLDTRAIVHLSAGDPHSAEKDLQRAMLASPSPDRYFHLAQALLMQQRRNEAQAAFDEARRRGVSKETVHPLEHSAYAILENTLN